MILTVLVPVAILGAVLVAAMLVLQRGAGGLDAAPRNLLRLYLYLGSMVSLLVLVFGLSLTTSGILGAIAPEFTYGGQPPGVLRETPPVPPGQTAPPLPPKPTPQDQNDRRTRESLLQGITSAAAGALFWWVHWYGRRQVESADERGSLLRRAYFMLGVAIFGIASIVLLPTAVYNALRWALIPAGQFEFRPGAGESLAAALAVLPFWLVFLRIVLADYREGRPATEPMPPPPVS